jgi:SAM-dependent methyltransferase
MLEKCEWWEDFFHGPWGDLQSRGYPPEKTSAEVDFLIAALDISSGQHVLDLACGIGRHSIELAARGMEVTGIDFNGSALALAERAATARSVTPRFVQRDMRNLDWSRQFDAAFCFYSSFGYFEDEADDLAVAKRIAAALRPGGRFLIDTHVTETLFPLFQERRWTWIDEQRSSRLLEETRWDVATGRVSTEWTFVEKAGVRSSRSSIRTYSYRELCTLLREAGFRELVGLETGTRKTFALGSKRLSLIATA